MKGRVLTVFAGVAVVGGAFWGYLHLRQGDSAQPYTPSRALQILNDRSRPWFAETDDVRSIPPEAVKYMLIDLQPLEQGHPFRGRRFEILDLRSESEHDQSHVKFSGSLPADHLDHALEEGGKLALMDRGSVLILYGAEEPGAGVCEAIRKAGFRSIYVLEGGFSGWANRGFDTDKTKPGARKAVHPPHAHSGKGGHPAGPESDLEVRQITYEEIPTISAKELKELMDSGEEYDLVYVSVREFFDKKHIPGSKWMNLTEVYAAYKDVPRDRTVVFYCGCCEGNTLGRSGWPVDALQQLGFKSVRHLAGHTQAWEDAGFPLKGTEVSEK